MVLAPSVRETLVIHLLVFAASASGARGVEGRVIKYNGNLTYTVETASGQRHMVRMAGVRLSTQPSVRSRADSLIRKVLVGKLVTVDDSVGVTIKNESMLGMRLELALLRTGLVVSTNATDLNHQRNQATAKEHRLGVWKAEIPAVKPSPTLPVHRPRALYLNRTTHFNLDNVQYRGKLVFRVQLSGLGDPKPAVLDCRLWGVRPSKLARVSSHCDALLRLWAMRPNASFVVPFDGAVPKVRLFLGEEETAPDLPRDLLMSGLVLAESTAPLEFLAQERFARTMELGNWAK